MFRLRSLGLAVGLSGCAAVAAEVGTGAVGSAISSATRMAERTLAADAKPNDAHPIALPELPKAPAPAAAKSAQAADPAPMPIPVRPAPAPVSANPPVAAAAPAPAAQFYDAEIDPRYSLRRDFGNGVGYQSGFTYLEAFVPVWQTPGESLTFLNARIVNFDDDSFWETQVGGGARWLVDGSVLGVNGFWDGRNDTLGFYNQLGFGFELLREKWEFRSNFYFPIGTTRNVAGTTFANPRFTGTNIAVDRQIATVNAMQGWDIEAGRQVPSCHESLRTYAYLGYYHYQAANVPSVDGFRARLESWYDETVSTNLAIQRDDVFGTTVTGGLSLHFGGVPKGSRSANPLAAKLGNRVVRDPNIVLQASTQTRTELATDAAGAPIEVRHVSSNALPGGNGSVENPYRTLTALQGGSSANQILFAHGGSLFTNQIITLKNGQRFLGEGGNQTFTASQGTFLLPRATANAAAPRLVRTGGATNTVTLARDNEVSGFNYARTGGTGGFIAGTGNVGTFNIHSNTTAGGASAVNLGGLFGTATGNGTIANNAFGAHVAAVNVLGGGALRLLVEGNRFNGGALGVNVGQTGGNHVFAIRNNAFGSLASVTDLVTGGTQTLQLRNNTGTGAYLLTRTGGTFRVETSLPTNTPTPTVLGTITPVPPGTAGFGN
jgi:hypothetical protein